MKRWEETPNLGLPLLIDLDGTLSEKVDNTTGPIGEPIQEAITAVRKLINAGFDCRIYTARHWGDEAQIKAWLVRQNLSMKIICGKPLGHIFDDKADRPTELLMLAQEL